MRGPTQMLGSVAKVTNGPTPCSAPLPTQECPPALPKKAATFATGILTASQCAVLLLDSVELVLDEWLPNASGNGLSPLLNLLGLGPHSDLGLRDKVDVMLQVCECVSHFWRRVAKSCEGLIWIGLVIQGGKGFEPFPSAAALIYILTQA